MDELTNVRCVAKSYANGESLRYNVYQLQPRCVIIKQGDKMKGYIYLLVSPRGKKYIGRTFDFERRMKQFGYESRINNTPIYREISKYGFDSFEKTILEVVEGNREVINNRLNELEKDYIDRYNTSSDGLNVHRWDTHNRVIKLSKETRKKMSKSHTGKKHSKESIAKRSGKNAYQGKTVYSEMLGKSFPTLRAAARFVGVNNGSKISEFIKGERKSVGKHPVTNEPVNDWKYI